MDNIALWITATGAIVIPIGGYVINGLITKKIDELIIGRKEDRELFFARLDASKKIVEDTYVRKDLYQQSMEYHQKEVDVKFTSLVASISKLDGDVKARFDDIKTLINEKFSKVTNTINNH